MLRFNSSFLTNLPCIFLQTVYSIVRNTLTFIRLVWQNTLNSNSGKHPTPTSVPPTHVWRMLFKQSILFISFPLIYQRRIRCGWNGVLVWEERKRGGWPQDILVTRIEEAFLSHLVWIYTNSVTDSKTNRIFMFSVYLPNNTIFG